MSTVNRANGYQREYPELFPWQLITSYKLADVAVIIAANVIEDLKTPDRNYVSGLRHALNIIANIAQIDE